MARLVIDISPAPVTWRGFWFSASWGGVPLCVRRDPVRDIAREFIRAGKAKADDTIVLMFAGVEIDREEMGQAARRRADPQRLPARIVVATSDGGLAADFQTATGAER